MKHIFAIRFAYSLREVGTVSYQGFWVLSRMLALSNKLFSSDLSDARLFPKIQKQQEINQNLPWHNSGMRWMLLDPPRKCSSGLPKTGDPHQRKSREETLHSHKHWWEAQRKVENEVRTSAGQRLQLSCLELFHKSKDLLKIILAPLVHAPLVQRPHAQEHF